MRLFIALTPPPDVQRHVWDAFAPLRARVLPVKWVPPENVHLTLKFLGEVAAERQAEISGALASAAQGTKTITLCVRGAGAFPNTRAPRVIWAGIEPDPERDARARDWAGVAELLDGLHVDTTTVLDGVDLVRSELRRGGSVYHRVHRERLS